MISMIILYIFFWILAEIKSKKAASSKFTKTCQNAPLFRAEMNGILIIPLP